MSTPTTGYAVNIMVGAATEPTLAATSQQPTLAAAYDWVLDSTPDTPQPCWATAVLTRRAPTGDSAPTNGGQDAWLCARTIDGAYTRWVPTMLAPRNGPA